MTLCVDRNEKTFENAALTLYRQKSFFNRWRNKSITSEAEIPQLGSTQKDRLGIAGRLSKAAKNASKPGSRDESIPLRGGANQDSKRPRAIDHPVSNHRSSTSFQVELAPTSHTSSDSSTQTGFELLMPLVLGLRRRKRSSDDRSANCDNLRAHSIAEGRRHSKVSSGSRSSLDRYFLRKPSGASMGGDSSETDLLLANDHEPGAARQHQINAAANHSFLSSDGILTCDDSTSEEDLTDQHLLEDPNPDLDEILSGAGQMQGSFLSLHSLKLDIDTPPPPSYESCTPRKSDIEMGLSQVSTVNLIDVGDRDASGHHYIPLDSRGRQCHNAADQHHNVSSDGARMQPPYRRTSQTASIQEAGGATPSILIDQTPISSVAGSRRGGARRKDFFTQADVQRRPSGISGTSSSSSECAEALAALSPEELRSMGISELDDDSESVAKFQDYLRSRGLDLDLTSVQSSDV